VIVRLQILSTIDALSEGPIHLYGSPIITASTFSLKNNLSGKQWQLLELLLSLAMIFISSVTQYRYVLSVIYRKNSRHIFFICFAKIHKELTANEFKITEMTKNLDVSLEQKKKYVSIEKTFPFSKKINYICVKIITHESITD
jgi:hypothetical protein